MSHIIKMNCGEIHQVTAFHVPPAAGTSQAGPKGGGFRVSGGMGGLPGQQGTHGCPSPREEGLPLPCASR